VLQVQFLPRTKFQAATVTVSRNTLKRRGNTGIRAIIVNSGCADAVTGKGGLEDAEKMGAEADRCFDPPTDSKGGSSLVMSTGFIGQRLVAPRASHYFVAKIIADCLSKRYFVRFQLPLIR
jgi:N-acetylglutamate synthase/N-acetylornithine aminotransferase